MKAILVIDIEADELPNDAYANVYVFGKYYKEQEDDFVACLGDVPLKPMPAKMEVDDLQMKALAGLYATAWNDCLDEIMGETE